MILTTTRHGRTARDVRNLRAHLNKSVDQQARVVAIGGVSLSNADDVLRYMQMMRDGSRADVSMHHITISPLHRLDDAQRDDAVRRILSAMGADDHAFILWEHDGKPRSARAADQHFHLVIGHVGPDGKALDDAHSYTRLEAAARSLEADFGEDLTPSRRTAAVMAALREQGRGDVADMLLSPSDLPASAMSSTRRAAASREGVDLPKMQAAIRAAWTAVDGPAAFRNAIQELGAQVAPGEKRGVFVVSVGGVEIGALDRIVREKRGAVAARMKEVEHVRGTPETTEPGRGDLSIDPGDTPRRADLAPPTRAVGGDGPGGRAPGGDQGDIGGDPARPEASDDVSGRPSSKGRSPRRAQAAIAAHGLARVGRDGRLKALAADLRAMAVPAIDRVTAYLDRRETAVRSLPAPEQVAEPPGLASLRGRLREAAEQARRTWYATNRDHAALRQFLQEDRPRGLWAWISGQVSQWHRDVIAARHELTRIDNLRACRDAAVDDLRKVYDPLSPVHASKVSSARNRQDQAERQMRRDLALIAAARRCLAEDPSLARHGERAVLQAARARLERDSREYDRQALAPAGPRFQ